MQIKVFEMNDIDWWAGPDLEATKAAYLENCSGDAEDVETAHELTEKELDETLFYTDGQPEDLEISFKDRLAEIVTDPKTTFPCFFASTEF